MCPALQLVVEGLRGRFPADALEVATVVLRQCRSHMADIVAAHHDARAAQIDGVRASAVTWLQQDALRANLLDEADLVSLLEHIERDVSAVDAGCLLRGLAEALDETVLPRGWRLRAGMKPLAVEGAGALPAVEAPLRSVFRGPLSPRRRSRGFVADEVSTTRLAPSDLRGFTLTVNWSAERALEELATPLPIGFVFPHPGPEAFAWQQYETDGRARFFDVEATPADEPDQLIQLFRDCDAAGARVVVAPELALRPLVVDAIAHWLDNEAEHTRVILPGSWHERVGADRANVAPLLVRRGGRFPHLKFNPYILPNGAAEDLCPVRPALTVLASRRWVVTWCICKDLLHPDTHVVLHALGAGLLLVASWSTRSHVFRTDAQGLTSPHQTVFAMANLVPAGEPDELSGLVLTPARNKGENLLLRAAVSPPCAMVWDEDGWKICS